MGVLIIDHAVDFLKASEELLSDLKGVDDPDNRNTKKYSFILTAAATLECILNRSIIDTTYSNTSSNARRRHADAFMSMSLRSKLDTLGYLTSNGNFMTDNEYYLYKELSYLISLRNQVTHKKEHYTEVNEDISEILRKKANDSPLNSFIELFDGFYEALEGLYEFIESDYDHESYPLFIRI